MKKSNLVILFIITLFEMVRGQEIQNNQLFDFSFNEAGIEKIVSAIESKSNYRFYYNHSDFDSLKFSAVIKQKTIFQTLDLIFTNTKFHYAIIENNEVVLTKLFEIRTTLANSIFTSNYNSNTINTPNFEPEIPDKKLNAYNSENKTYEIGLPQNRKKTGKVILSGYVKNNKSGEPIIGASIYVPSIKIGVVTNQFGNYSITLPVGKQALTIKSEGMKDVRRQIDITSDGVLNIEMQEQITALREVKISAEKVANIKSVEMGVSKLDIKNIKLVPAVFGEADVLRVILTLPGVQSVGEASTGFNVRGGSADQNLVLLNDATIYNPSHFFGFFSAFDPDIIQNVELYKSSIPERFGGRLSSVLEITEKEGNKKKFTGSAGIGLITSRINIEGPIDKEKTSFILGARTTYADWLLKLLPPAYANSKASFYDLNINITHQINAKNSLYLTTYLSRDAFKLNSDTNYNYGNRNISLKWKHSFTNKLYSLLIGGYDYYQYGIESNQNIVDAYRFNFNIGQLNLKYNFTYYISNKHTIDFGINSIKYKINPGSNLPYDNNSKVTPVNLPAEQALESAIYIGDKYDITPSLSLSTGLRYSIYNYLGPHDVNNYQNFVPKTIYSLLYTSKFPSNNQIINSYRGPEIRATVRYSISDDISIKAAYNTLHQYIHLLSNTTAISPTDVWKLSDPNIKPQSGDQISLGFYKNLQSNTIETSVEVYYKNLKNYLDYKSGATLVLNPHIETDVLPTNGKAYGIEFLIKKTAGQLNGWASYTYSRTFLKQNNPEVGALINNGLYYPANYDKPHSVNIVGNYRFTHRYSVSLNTIYSTGRPITYPIATYNYDGSQRVLYSNRNQYRIPDYFRTDLSVNIDGNHKVHQVFHNSWTFGVYNLTGRDNAYSTFFTEQGGVINGYKLSIFATPIPFINYNIRF